MECKIDNCEVDKLIKNTADFQKKTSQSIDIFQKEIRSSIKDMDNRHTRAKNYLETELRSEFQRGLMTCNAKIDTNVSATTNFMIGISSDLGEIKGALGLKVDKDETGKLRTSIMDKVTSSHQEAAKEIEKLKERQSKSSNKILYLIISLLTSGLFLMFGYYIANNTH